jgi:hypothetical protein
MATLRGCGRSCGSRPDRHRVGVRRRAVADLEVVDSDDRAGRPDAGERGSGAGSGAGAASGSAEDCLLQCERRHDRQEDAHRPALVVDFFAELAAAGTLAQVATKVGPAQRAAAEVCELLADHGAISLARGATGDQRFACLEHERLHLVLWHAEDLADLLMAERVHLGEHERGALFVGQPAEIEHEVAQVLAPLGLDGEALCNGLVEIGDGLLAPGAQDRVAAVASDREQPRPQVHLAVARDEIVVGREEGVLDRILGLLRTTEHVAAEGQNLAMVTVIQRLEGGSSALPDKVDEMCVAGDTQ